ncbi:SRPBCC family protein [Marinococcus halophilus]|uniref:SRPBCC family protein n=1 Tax=Marinococcus halophilus TaxID=1371 RepID=UPI0009A66480|nr:SRPBCC family protein [Marinococcus halophilus]
MAKYSRIIAQAGCHIHHAEPAQVYEAWTNPELMKTWMFPSGESRESEAEANVTEGGAWSVVNESQEETYRAYGEYLKIDPPERIEKTLVRKETGGQDEKIKVEINSILNGSQVIVTQDVVFLHHEQLHPKTVEEHLREQRRQTEKYWHEMFSLLSKQLTPS